MSRFFCLVWCTVMVEECVTFTLYLLDRAMLLKAYCSS